MRFYIYQLSNCKVCTQREGSHNDIASILENAGIEVVGVHYGHINGKDYNPFPQHDSQCRNPNNPSNYVAPIYILEDDNNTVKMPDISKYSSSDDYASYIIDIANQLHE